MQYFIIFLYFLFLFGCDAKKKVKTEKKIVTPRINKLVKETRSKSTNDTLSFSDTSTYSVDFNKLIKIIQHEDYTELKEYQTPVENHWLIRQFPSENKERICRQLKKINGIKLKAINPIYDEGEKFYPSVEIEIWEFKQTGGAQYFDQLLKGEFKDASFFL